MISVICRSLVSSRLCPDRKMAFAGHHHRLPTCPYTRQNHPVHCVAPQDRLLMSHHWRPADQSGPCRPWMSFLRLWKPPRHLHRRLSSPLLRRCLPQTSRQTLPWCRHPPAVWRPAEGSCRLRGCRRYAEVVSPTRSAYWTDSQGNKQEYDIKPRVLGTDKRTISTIWHTSVQPWYNSAATSLTYLCNDHYPFPATAKRWFCYGKYMEETCRKLVSYLCCTYLSSGEISLCSAALINMVTWYRNGKVSKWSVA